MNGFPCPKILLCDANGKFNQADAAIAPATDAGWSQLLLKQWEGLLVWVDGKSLSSHIPLAFSRRPPRRSLYLDPRPAAAPSPPAQGCPAHCKAPAPGAPD